MPLRRPATWIFASALAILAACSSARNTESAATTDGDCVRCHGGDGGDTTGAPPRSIRGQTATTDVGVGAHRSHISYVTQSGVGYACTECHPDPRTGGKHRNGQVDVVFGPFATHDGADAPSFDAKNTFACSNTYCHGGFRGGNAQNAPVWTKVGQGQANCGSCHLTPPDPPHPAVGSDLKGCNGCHPQTVDPDGKLIPPSAGGLHLNGKLEGGHLAEWMDTASAGFHGPAANRNISACQVCHGADLAGGWSGIACAKCHTAGGAARDFAVCTGCHGGTDNASGAPPRATWGNGDPVAIGAHKAHVAGSDIAPPFDCTFCHVKPASIVSSGHVDGAVTVTGYTGNDPVLAAAVKDPGWDHVQATCATSYCHGNFRGGNTANVPNWTKVGQGQAACGTCHDLPPGAPHGSIPPGDLTLCNACHPATIDASGNLIPPSQGGMHLDGVAEATGHDVAWMDPTSASFHAYDADRGLARCQVCHGADLSGGASGVACAQCHKSGGPAPDLSTCTGCHGGEKNATGAPPRATWGNQDPVAVGAHTTHVTQGAMGRAFDCDACHLKPADPFTASHVDGNVTVTGYTGTDPALAAVVKDPGWSHAAASCATSYCHGNFRGGSTANAPTWTKVGQGQATCGTCHDTPPASPHPAVTGGLTACNACHSETVDASGAIIPASAGGKHLNGQLEGGHQTGWMDTASPNFHAYSANQGLAGCQQCHGQKLDGVGGSTSVACTQCHAPGGQAAQADFSTCTGCHGGTDNTTGAPPRATWGNSDPVAVGAHSRHVGPNPITAPIDCAECHPRPQDMFTLGHIDGNVTVAFAGPVSGLAPTATWNAPTAPTCSNTNCHGNFQNGIASNTPNWTQPRDESVTCGTCHNPRPTGYLHTKHQTQFFPRGSTTPITCDQCHNQIATSTGPTGPTTLIQSGGSGPALHVNGRKDVQFKLGGTFQPDPATGDCAGTAGSCSSTACHPEVTPHCWN